MLARVSGTAMGMSRFCESWQRPGHGHRNSAAGEAREQAAMATAYSPELNRISLCASNDRFLTRSQTALHMRFGTSTAIQSSALRAPAIATREDETEGS